MKSKQPNHIEIRQEELEAILVTIKPILSLSQFKTLESAIKMLIWLQFVIKEKSISITRLGRMLFGKRNESLKNLKKAANAAPPNESAEFPPKEATKTASTDSNGATENSIDNQQIQDLGASDQAPNSSSVETESPSENVEKAENFIDNQHTQALDTLNRSNASSAEDSQKEKKGHGRLSMNNFNVWKIIHIPHECLKVGQKCPLCRKGALYGLDPEIILVINGQPPLKGEAYSAQGLRCNLCQKVFRATFPQHVMTQPKANFTARAIVCLTKYQLGTPLYRLEAWQKLFCLPISDSEMWEWTESVALALFPVHQALLDIAAKGDVIHNDDTKGKILDLMAENRLVEQTQSKVEKHRKGIFTSILLSIVKDGYQIATYITGRKNSGENLDELLDRRPKDFGKAIQSCDASTQNISERHETDLASCFNHARHNFCELIEVWPNEVLTIIQMCNAIFRNDRASKDMTPENRLKYHQKHSATIMNQLKSYCNSLLDTKSVEPNSSLGKAINYLNNHWEGLTLFLRNGKAPLSNNAGERAIKSQVLIRKNSYFYKSCWGAFVGDTLLSIIKTCNLNSINAYDYLIAIQANAEEVKKDPKAWLPWNYTKNISIPFVNTQNVPLEEVYQKSSNGSSVITAVVSSPSFENNKKTLRERARDFFKRVYPAWVLRSVSPGYQ